MPTAAPKPCLQPGCPVLVRDGSSRCEAHKREAWAPARIQVKRVTGRRLQVMRQALFNREPLCRKCAGKGFVTLAVIRDHIKALAEGGEDSYDNVQPLCQACSDVKTAGESRRGRGVQMSAAYPAETDPQVKFLRAQVLGNFSLGGAK